MQRHSYVQSNDAFAITPDGRYRVPFKHQVILLPSLAYCQDCDVSYRIVDEGGALSYGTLKYDYVLTHASALRALLSDAVSINFSFHQPYHQKFFGVYGDVNSRGPDYLDVSLDVSEATLSWPGVPHEILQRIDAMALGTPPFDRDGFSKVTVRGFEWNDPNATLFVAPRREVIDAAGQSLFFLCDSTTCLLNTISSFPLGAFATSDGFHFSKYIRFSAGLAKASQESLLKQDFAVIRAAMADMIKN